MFVLVVTGGIGSGKSEAAQVFAGLGASVLDLDVMARDLVLRDVAVRKRLVAAFGTRILSPSGGVSAAALAKAAFASPEDAARLNAIVHPMLTAVLDASLARLCALPDPPAVVVLEVPLLVEAPRIAQLADRVLALAAPDDVRVARAVERGMTEDDARRRLAAQALDEQRAALADDVIVNDGDLVALRGALEDYWEREVLPRVA